jgi:hypothetical protein
MQATASVFDKRLSLSLSQSKLKDTQIYAPVSQMLPPPDAAQTAGVTATPALDPLPSAAA